MDLVAVRTFVAVAEAGQFQLAAAQLAITQQAVSKRIAALEKDLGVPLFARTARGARLTIDGQAFLPHARALLDAEERAAASVRPGRRPLRVDVIGRRLATAAMLRDFHRAHPEVDLDVVILFDSDAGAAAAAIRSGAIDASFRCVVMPGQELPAGIEATPVHDEPLQLCTGPGHEFASARAVTPAQLAGHRIWMPGNLPGTEWSAYYDALAAEFGLTIDTLGPDFGVEGLLDTIAGSSTIATFLSEHTPLVWPAVHDLRRIPLRDPTPVYPHSLLWHADNPHPALAALRGYLASRPAGNLDTEVWTPPWALRCHPRADPARS
ncbi:putative LysR-family transcriptional regulator [Streptomyces ambofaciens ATCC 23877]|uniref:Putative LysR-family transcriptional regulator n=1 Tax=Streptomyces ambofaciens (strain ATCC 23877 / 3486 / DSM 40053 / JCM 4204 / NBRC 12836 / NRRL B-2516) TaxID=278992 RepID=A3KIY5_STRA7|nr:LysR family transcriptional regulator [Streptomyces ambofaciens]AKZ53810.1 putative LysR-family transcriptional regulator [Streptomyces ambofaciens ATCC 23877]CAJ89669.1 putative LysR-family transcriptional regulator [Streptomyces ambofaciens ATCC 23877]